MNCLLDPLDASISDLSCSEPDSNGMVTNMSTPSHDVSDSSGSRLGYRRKRKSCTSVDTPQSYCGWRDSNSSSGRALSRSVQHNIDRAKSHHLNGYKHQKNQLSLSTGMNVGNCLVGMSTSPMASIQISSSRCGTIRELESNVTDTFSQRGETTCSLYTT